jgi:hypothetical protein
LIILIPPRQANGAAGHSRDYLANPGHVKQNTCPYRKFNPIDKSRFFSAKVSGSRPAHIAQSSIDQALNAHHCAMTFDS